ncbi:phosphate signaling complex protein PhoU [candidate division KSB1 bacterium]|nr:phosphate signaling complex protein PhoU [candidate division KSB1 bacterium]
MQKDIDRIKNTILEMARLNESAMRHSVEALLTRNRQLAHTVILRDRTIDALETELDRLCIEFIVRQQPVARHLRFVYSTIKIIREMERIGDYAESIARQVLCLIPIEPLPPLDLYVELADLSIKMFHDSIQAFINGDEKSAKDLMVIEDEADGLRSRINQQLLKLQDDGDIVIEAVNPLMTIARRLERLADEAKNICEESIYMATGEVAKHKHGDLLYVLFVDKDNSCLSRMAEAVGQSLRSAKVHFSSAGLEPAAALDPIMIDFLSNKQVPLSLEAPRALSVEWQVQTVHVIIAFGKEIRKALPPETEDAIIFDWPIPDPCKKAGVSAEIHHAYGETLQLLQTHIHDLVQAIIGQEKIDIKKD